MGLLVKGLPVYQDYYGSGKCLWLACVTPSQPFMVTSLSTVPHYPIKFGSPLAGVAAGGRSEEEEETTTTRKTRKENKEFKTF